MTERRAYEVLASNLHRLMFERGLTLEAVARAAGISVEQLQAICSGEFDPELEIVDRIAQDGGALSTPRRATYPPGAVGSARDKRLSGSAAQRLRSGERRSEISSPRQLDDADSQHRVRC